MKFKLWIDEGRYHLINTEAPADLQPCIVHTSDTEAEAQFTLDALNDCAAMDAELETKRDRPRNYLDPLPFNLN